jgi:hypothetical protein
LIQKWILIQRRKTLKAQKKMPYVDEPQMDSRLWQEQWKTSPDSVVKQFKNKLAELNDIYNQIGQFEDDNFHSAVRELIRDEYKPLYVETLKKLTAAMDAITLMGGQNDTCFAALTVVHDHIRSMPHF